MRTTPTPVSALHCPTFRVYLLLALISVGFTLPAHAKKPRHHQSKPVVRAIERQEGKWLAAQISGNVSTLSSLMAEDYLGISPDGTLESKTETLSAIKSGAVHLTAITLSEKKIRVYGNTAVVVSKATVTGTDNGKDFSGLYRYTRVYHFNGSTWKIVSFEASKIRERANRKNSPEPAAPASSIAPETSPSKTVAP